MTYKLANQLKDVGFPQSPYTPQECQHGEKFGCQFKSFRDPKCKWVSVPNLSDLIKECDNNFEKLMRDKNGMFVALPPMEFCIKNKYIAHHTEFPDEAVANLYLQLKK